MTSEKLMINFDPAWPRQIREHWSDVRIVRIEATRCENCADGVAARVRVRVRLGLLTSYDVVVGLTVGSAIVARDPSAASVRLAHASSNGHGSFTFEPELPCAVLEGRLGFTIRVAPDPERGIVSVAPVMRAVYCGGAVSPSSHSRHIGRYGYVSAVRPSRATTHA